MTLGHIVVKEIITKQALLNCRQYGNWEEARMKCSHPLCHLPCWVSAEDSDLCQVHFIVGLSACTPASPHKVVRSFLLFFCFYNSLPLFEPLPWVLLFGSVSLHWAQQSTGKQETTSIERTISSQGILDILTSVMTCVKYLCHLTVPAITGLILFLPEPHSPSSRLHNQDQEAALQCVIATNPTSRSSHLAWIGYDSLTSAATGLYHLSLLCVNDLLLALPRRNCSLSGLLASYF